MPEPSTTAAPPSTLPTRARTLATQIAAHIDRLDQTLSSDDDLAIYGRRAIHAEITGLMRRDGVGLLGELAGEVERLSGLVDSRPWRAIFGRPLSAELRAELNSRSNWDGDEEG